MSDVVTQLRFVERDGKKILQMLKCRIGGGGGEYGAYVCAPTIHDHWQDVPLTTEPGVGGSSEYPDDTK